MMHVFQNSLYVLTIYVIYSLCTTLKDVLDGYQVQHLLSEYGYRCGQVHTKLSESGH
jgi:hypothetical protein